MARQLLRLLVALLACSTGAHTQQPSADAAARWAAKSPPERALLLEHFQELQQLSPEEREALDARAAGMAQFEQQVEAQLAPQERLELEQLPPHERGQKFREHLFDRAREKGARIQSKMPPEWVGLLENAAPSQRAHLLEGLRDRSRERSCGGALEHLCDKLGREPGEKAQLMALPLEQRLEQLMRLRRQLIERLVADHGLPAWIDSDRWNALEPLEDREFVAAWEQLVPFDQPFGHGSRTPGTGGFEGFGAPPPEFGAPRRNFGGPDARPEDDPWRELERLSRPTSAEQEEFAALDPQERKRLIAERVRQRTLDFLRQCQLLEERDLQALLELRGSDFSQALRELLKERLRQKHRR